MIDSKPHLSRTCKTSLWFAPLAVHALAGCSAFPFYSPTKPLIRLYFKYKTVLIPTLKIFFIFYIFIINVNISNKFYFWNISGLEAFEPHLLCKRPEIFIKPNNNKSLHLVSESDVHYRCHTVISYFKKL